MFAAVKFVLVPVDLASGTTLSELPRVGH